MTIQIQYTNTLSLREPRARRVYANRDGDLQLGYDRSTKVNVPEKYIHPYLIG